MPLDATRPQFTTLLTNDQLARVERLRINASRRFTNKSRGEHLAGRGGASIEFSDYRDYAPGDDVRFVDWNIFSRLHRPYMKLYRQEEEMHVLLLVDASASMRFEGKFDRARQLAAAFGVMGLLNQERVSVFAFHQPDGAGVRLPPCTGRGSFRKLFRFLEALEPGGACPLEAGIDGALRHHAGRGAVVVLSDFLTPTDLAAAFNKLFGTGLELHALQILGPTELDPDLAADLRLVDCETSLTLDVSAGAEVLGIYHEYLDRLAGELAQHARRRGGRFLSAGSDVPLDQLLFDDLMRRGWLR